MTRHDAAKMSCPKHNEVTTEPTAGPLAAGFGARLCLQSKPSEQDPGGAAGAHRTPSTRELLRNPARARGPVLVATRSAATAELLSDKGKCRDRNDCCRESAKVNRGLERASEAFILPFRSQKIAPKVERFLKKTFANVRGKA